MDNLYNGATVRTWTRGGMIWGRRGVVSSETGFRKDTKYGLRRGLGVPGDTGNLRWDEVLGWVGFVVKRDLGGDETRGT